MSSSVRYRPQKRRIVAGATQYNTSMAIPASKNASGERVLFSHLLCIRADHLANQGRHVSRLRPSGKTAGNCAAPSHRRCK